MGKISITKCNDYTMDNILMSLNGTFKNLGGISKYVSPGTKVLLKPNLLMGKKPELAATTHPSIVSAIASIIKQAGGIVTIADSPGGPYTNSMLERVYAVCGMKKAAEETGFKLNYDLSQVKVDNPMGKYLKKISVIKPLVDADIIINIPKLKTHGQMVYTGAVKNMFGAVAGILKAEFHMRMSKYDEFANALIDIFLSVKPTLNIMDAVVGMEGAGPSAGTPKHIGLILAGENGFELDFTALSVVDTDPMIVPVIKHAVERQLCPGNLSNIELLGENLDSVKIKDFDIPQKFLLKNLQFSDRGLPKILLGALKPKPVFIKKLCIGCSQCADNCPVNIIEINNCSPKADLSKCIRCFCCQELCPEKAVIIKRSLLVRILMKAAGSLVNLFMNLRKTK